MYIRKHQNRIRYGIPMLLAALPLMSGALCGLGSPPDEWDGGSLDAGPKDFVDAGPPPVPDEIPPTIAILGPVEDCLAGDIRFSAKAVDDNAGIGVVAMKFASRTIEVEAAEANVYNADFYVGNLLTGTYELIVTAIDLENNRTETTRSFGVAREGEYLNEGELECGTPPPPPPVDETPPILEMLSPSAAFTTHVGESLSITVSVEDDIGPIFASAAIGETELPFGGDARLRSMVFPASALPEGPTTLRLIARDDAGNETSLSHELIIDHTPPQLIIVSPLATAEVVAFTDVVAEISDNQGVAVVRLFESGQNEALGTALQPSSDSRWGVIYRLPCDGLPRDVTFLMQAEDFAQNVGIAEVNVHVLPDGCASD